MTMKITGQGLLSRHISCGYSNDARWCVFLADVFREEQCLPHP